jgi:hypothetical protein
MERRMAALFVVALALIAWQALRTEPVLPPDFEISTKEGEQLGPPAVPSWRSLPELPRALAERVTLLEQRALAWPLRAAAQDAPDIVPDCKLFVRISGHHWAERPASSPSILRWLGRPDEPARIPAWRQLHFPVAAFLDDDDGDGDPLDDGELREVGPGAEIEAFCGGEAARVSEVLP